MTPGSMLAVPSILHEGYWSMILERVDRRVLEGLMNWSIMERFSNLSSARKREQEIKWKKSRRYVDELIAGANGTVNG